MAGEIFEAGETYYADDAGIPPITVDRRTIKTLYVHNDDNSWAMRIKIDARGDEYVTDSSVPKRWQGCFTYSARQIGGTQA